MEEVRKIRIMPAEEADIWINGNCPDCIANYNYAKKLGWRVIVDTEMMDIIGVVVPPREKRGGATRKSPSKGGVVQDGKRS